MKGTLSPNQRVSYVPTTKKPGDGGRAAPSNSVKQYAGRMMRSEIARTDGQLSSDFQKVCCIVSCFGSDVLNLQHEGS